MISKPKPKTLSVSQPVQKTNLKRKNPNQPDEFNPKLVRTKLTSAENTNPNNQDLIQINLKKGPATTTQKHGGKENEPKKVTNLKKPQAGNPILNAIERSLNKFGTKPAKITSTEASRSAPLKQIREDKNANSGKAKYEELMKAVKDFDTKRKALLTNLTDLTNAADEKKVELENSAEKLRGLEQGLEAQKTKQAEDLQQLNSKIKMLKETQRSLTQFLAQKKAENNRLDIEEQENKTTIKTYNDYVYNNKVLLSQLLRKKEDLGSFITNVEEAIRNTNEKVRSRCEDVSVEEKKSLILEECLHSKKQNFRTLLFLRGPKVSFETSEQNMVYKIHTHDNLKRVKVDSFQNNNKQNPIFYEFDSIYHTNPYQERERVIFRSEEQTLYENLLSSIFETESAKNYLFLILANGSNLFKDLLNKTLSEHTEINPSQDITIMKFDNQAMTTSEVLSSVQEFEYGMNFDDLISTNYLVTLQIKLKNFACPKRLSFILTSGSDTQLLDLLKNSINPKKTKKGTPALNNSPEQNNSSILPFIKELGHSSISYAMLALDAQKYKSDTAMDIETDPLNMLRALNRLRN